MTVSARPLVADSVFSSASSAGPRQDVLWARDQLLGRTGTAALVSSTNLRMSAISSAKTPAEPERQVWCETVGRQSLEISLLISPPGGRTFVVQGV